MSVFKRAEIWVLVVLCAAATWYVLRLEPADRDGLSENAAAAPSSTETAPEALPSPHRLSQVLLSREASGELILEITVQAHNQGEDSLEITAESVPLETGDGSRVPALFTPFDAPVTLEPGDQALVSLRYWAGDELLDETLALRLEGATVPVKAARPFDPDSLGAGEHLRFSSPEWEVPPAPTVDPEPLGDAGA